MHATPAVNPQFDSQTKENMTLVKTKFGSECKIGDEMIDAVCKGGLRCWHWVKCVLRAWGC